MVVLYFYHLPKCGGTYVNHLLKKFAKNLNGEYISFTNLEKNKKNDIYDKALISYIENLKTKDCNYLFIHHHHGYYGLAEIIDTIKKTKTHIQAMGNEFYLFTCLRQPLSYRISQVNYLRNSCNMPNVDFDTIIDDDRNHNSLSKYLLYNHQNRYKDFRLSINKDEIIKISQDIDFIFLQEKMDDLVSTLNLLLKTSDLRIDKKANKGEHLLLPTDKQVAELLKCDELDMFFYNLVTKDNSST